MSIELHCPQCGKLIRAPNEAGGKHGKCPYCKNKVYVPTPKDEIETIALAPINEDEERHEQELRRESARDAASVAGDKSAVPTGDAVVGGGGALPLPADTPGEVVDIGAEVVAFIVALRDAKLDKADKVVETLKRAGTRARDHVEGMMLDEMPPKVKNVPPPVLKGFLKQLLGRLG